MVRGKPSSRLDRGVDIPFTLSLEIVFLNFIVDQHCDFKGQGWTSYKGGPWSPVVGESVPIHKPERKANGCLGTTRRCSKRVC